ncbi:phage/plasmid primase, P4 family [Gordonia sp. 852002-10350_SCH5691597]|uniref:phage/plasmid primase, P4 family n=1 Tax=Gordonia sp. 852002-10350_SCH5691597 TaxID=1834085 RepID=UPI000B1A399B|nr:phage/plasmid primase, P4 family [Gordonia sp. 852002-10350_SCH5691597]
MSRNDRSPRSARASAGLVPNDENASDSSTVARRDTQSAVSVYRSRGWCPLPLREGTKFPPVDDTTGNKPYPDVPVVWAEFAEDHDAARANLANRMPAFTDEDHGLFEVIGIDVDEYDEKHGAETLAALIAEHGELPPTFSSTSRGADSPSRIYFYLVPAGMKWAGKPGPDIEIIQRTHRYAVAWPSVVEGREYRWYDPQGRACDVPDVATFPDLPDSWVEHLRKGKAEAPRADVEEFDDLAEALGWLEENIPGYDAPMSGQMDRQTDPDKLAEEATGGAHDAMLARVHEVVRLAAEGHHGLKAALDRIESAFAAEVLGDRRDMLTARLEWNRALCGDVSDLADDVANDRVRISKVGGYTADDIEIDVSGLREALSWQVVPQIGSVDVTPYDSNDTDRGRIFNEAMGDLLKPIAGGDEWAFWNDRLGRLFRLDESKVIGRFWSRAVIENYKQTAERLRKSAVELEAVGNGDDAKDAESQAKAIHRDGVSAGNLNKIRPGLNMAHIVHPHPIDPAEFDTDAMTLGTPNGIIDYTDAKRTNATVYDVLRRGGHADKVLSSTVEYTPGIASPVLDTFFQTFIPNRETRRYVQRALGYCLLGGNPDRRIVFLLGQTSTGKSSLIEACGKCLGDYAHSFEVNTLFRETKDGKPVPELLSLRHSRMIFASEVGADNRLHVNKIKRMTGGDTQTRRTLYSGKMQEFTPMFTPVITTNSMPRIDGADDALDARLLVLPFNHQAPRGGPKLIMPKEDPDALRALLVWLVDGLLDYLRNGLDTDVPAEVAKAQDGARMQVNEFRMWADRKFVTPDEVPTSKRVSRQAALDVWLKDRAMGRVPHSLRNLTDGDEFQERMRGIYGGRAPRSVTVIDKKGNKSRKSVSFYKTPFMLRDSAEREDDQ